MIIVRKWRWAQLRLILPLFVAMSQNSTVSILIGYGQDDRGSNPGKAGLRKMLGNSWVVEWLATSQGGLRSMKLGMCTPVKCSCIKTLVVLVFDGSVPPAKPLRSGRIVMSGSFVPGLFGDVFSQWLSLDDLWNWKVVLVIMASIPTFSWSDWGDHGRCGYRSWNPRSVKQERLPLYRNRNSSCRAVCAHAPLNASGLIS
jgi:hypothetical protein